MRAEATATVAASVISGIALVITAVLAIWSLKTQRALTDRTIYEQRRLAREERAWVTLSELCVDLILWLETKAETVTELRATIERGQSDESSADLQQQLENLRHAVLGDGEALADDPAQTESIKADRTARDLRLIWSHLELKGALSARLLLFGNGAVKSAFEEYKASEALPLIAGDDMGVWIVATEVAANADGKFRDALEAEIQSLMHREAHVTAPKFD